MEIKSYKILNTFFDFCSGIGAGRLGLEQAGLSCIGRAETSRLADKTYSLIHDIGNEKNFGNLKNLNKNNLPRFDVMIAGFPCQSFSIIGKQKGFLDIRGQIIFHLIRILSEMQPYCFILENVKGLVTHNNGITFKIIIDNLRAVGYDVCYQILTSSDYGVPQKRQRVYIIGIKNDLKLSLSNFHWPTPTPCTPLKDFLIDNDLIDNERINILSNYLNNSTNLGKFTLDNLLDMEGKIIDTRMNDLRIYTDICPTLRAHRDGILYIKNNQIFNLTGFEALLLQGFPKHLAYIAKNNILNRHLLMQAGNAMTVNVIAELGKSLIQFFNKEEIKI